MRLENRTVVLYGVDEPACTALVMEFARGMTLVYVADQPLDAVEAFAARIVAEGGVAEAAEVDLLDPGEVERYTEEVTDWSGGIDVAVVALAGPRRAGRLAVARTVARSMAPRGTGVVLVAAEDDQDQEFLALSDRAAADGVKVVPVHLG